MKPKNAKHWSVLALLVGLLVLVLATASVAFAVDANEPYAPYTAGPVVRELRYVPNNTAPGADEARPYAPYTEAEGEPYAPYTAGPVVRELRYMPYTTAPAVAPETSTDTTPKTTEGEPYAPYPLPR